MFEIYQLRQQTVQTFIQPSIRRAVGRQFTSIRLFQVFLKSIMKLKNRNHINLANIMLNAYNGI